MRVYHIMYFIKEFLTFHTKHSQSGTNIITGYTGNIESFINIIYYLYIYNYINIYCRYRVIEYYMTRCHGNNQLLEKFNLIGQTSEMARLYGIEFINVLSRGSQVIFRDVC